VLWLGGFTFYGAVVVPILHDTLDGLQAGGITRHVTDWLNLIGLVAVVLAWAWAWADRGGRQRGWASPRPWLVMISLLLIAQFGLHAIMDRRLDAGALRDFYPWHRAYLIVSTAQWAAQVALLLVIHARSASADDQAIR
jgi:hypothetical protein